MAKWFIVNGAAVNLDYAKLIDRRQVGSSMRYPADQSLKIFFEVPTVCFSMADKRPPQEYSYISVPAEQEDALAIALEVPPFPPAIEQAEEEVTEEQP